MNINTTMIEAVSSVLRDMLGEDFDADTFWDSLDGETDALDIVDAVLERHFADKALADATKAQAADLAARAKRIAERAEAHKKALMVVLNAAGEKKLERPLATVSKRAGSVSLSITDESAIPSQLTVTTVSPDKTAIRAALKEGEEIPGAELIRGPETISLRVK